MADTIEILLADLLAAAGPDGSILSERLRALWLDVELEITSLRDELLKSEFKNQDQECRNSRP